MYNTSEIEIDRIVWCLEANLPHPIIVSLLALQRGDVNLEDVWSDWVGCDYWSVNQFENELFIEAVDYVAGITVHLCWECSDWTDIDGLTTLHNGEQACEDCLQEGYSQCRICRNFFPSGDVTYTEDSDEPFCDRCRDRSVEWCSYCEEYTYYGHEHEEIDACDCEAPHQRFRFPANGEGTVANDERLQVTLPAGTIDDEGQRLIHRLLLDTLLLHEDVKIQNYRYDILNKVLTAIGDTWHGQKGNYTRRLSREMYSKHKVKLPDGVLTEVGNLARAHSSDTSEWAVEFTRDLNQSADEFYHEDSCWWQSYFESRCALKSWGGLAIRAWDEGDYLQGRAFIQPLDADFRPTHDTLNAHSYVVFNCYGNLDQAKAARIVAHLTSKTYRKIGMESNPQYINGNSGWLICDEQTGQNAPEVLGFSMPAHHPYDAQEVTA